MADELPQGSGLQVLGHFDEDAEGNTPGDQAAANSGSFKLFGPIFGHVLFHEIMKCCKVVRFKKYDTILLGAHGQGCASLASRKMLALSVCCHSFSKYVAERSTIPRVFWTVFSDAYLL